MVVEDSQAVQDSHQPVALVAAVAKAAGCWASFETAVFLVNADAADSVADKLLATVLVTVLALQATMVTSSDLPTDTVAALVDTVFRSLTLEVSYRSLVADVVVAASAVS